MHSLQELENSLIPKNIFHTPQATVINFLARPSTVGLESAIEKIRKLEYRDPDFIEEAKKEIIKSCFLDKEARKAFVEYVKKNFENTPEVESDVSRFLKGMIVGYEKLDKVIFQCEEVQERSGNKINKNLRKYSFSNKLLSKLKLKEKSVADSIKEFFPKEKRRLIEGQILKAEDEEIREHLCEALRNYINSNKELEEAVYLELKKYQSLFESHANKIRKKIERRSKILKGIGYVKRAARLLGLMDLYTSILFDLGSVYIPRSIRKLKTNDFDVDNFLKEFDGVSNVYLKIFSENVKSLLEQYKIIDNKLKEDVKNSLTNLVGCELIEEKLNRKNTKSLLSSIEKYCEVAPTMDDAIESMKANAFSNAFNLSGLEKSSIVSDLYSLFDSGNPGDLDPYFVNMRPDDTRNPKLRAGLKYGLPIGIATAAIIGYIISTSDQDDDGISNWDEWFKYGTKWDDSDSDNDWWIDSEEIKMGTDPNVPSQREIAKMYLGETLTGQIYPLRDDANYREIVEGLVPLSEEGKLVVADSGVVGDWAADRKISDSELKISGDVDLDTSNNDIDQYPFDPLNEKHVKHDTGIFIVRLANDNKEGGSTLVGIYGENPVRFSRDAVELHPYIVKDFIKDHRNAFVLFIGDNYNQDTLDRWFGVNSTVLNLHDWYSKSYDRNVPGLLNWLGEVGIKYEDIRHEINTFWRHRVDLHKKGEGIPLDESILNRWKNEDTVRINLGNNVISRSVFNVEAIGEREADRTKEMYLEIARKNADDLQAIYNVGEELEDPTSKVYKQTQIILNGRMSELSVYMEDWPNSLTSFRTMVYPKLMEIGDDIDKKLPTISLVGTYLNGLYQPTGSDESRVDRGVIVGIARGVPLNRVNINIAGATDGREGWKVSDNTAEQISNYLEANGKTLLREPITNTIAYLLGTVEDLELDYIEMNRKTPWGIVRPYMHVIYMGLKFSINPDYMFDFPTGLGDDWFPPD